MRETLEPQGGMVDGFRHVHPNAQGQFTYWSQRARNRPRNRGLRIDYALVSAGLATSGALVDVLASFRDAGVNLTHIDKRPSRMDNWQYTFFIDLEGHQADPAVTAALEDARAHCASLHVRGSYPRSTRVL